MGNLHWVLFFQKLVLLFIGSILTFFLSSNMMASLTQPEYDEEKSVLNAKRLNIKNSLTVHEKQIVTDVVFPEDVSVAFKDVVGLDKQKELITQLLLHTYPNVKHVNGLILHGLPGTGKTMLAKAIAKESQSVFINFNISSIEDKFVGESNRRLDALFSLAEKLKSCVIFMDELDGFGSSRSVFDQSHVNNLKTLLLQRMDGVASLKGRIIFIGATNNLDGIDPALRRRMRLHIKIDLPDTIAIKCLIKTQTTVENVDSIASACCAKNASGSDISQLCVLAQYEAIKNKRTDIIHSDLQQAFNLLYDVNG
jgi:ATP-dependent 26S proteasome regulatory subunit